MDLYFSPLSCPVSSRITLYEAGAEAKFHRVNTQTGKTEAGDDYRRINPKGMVPALRTDDGQVLTENAAILQYIADRYPAAGLAPTGFGRYRLQEWLSFIGTELHKMAFTPLLSPRFDDAAKATARETAGRHFAYLDAHLEDRQWLLDDFSVADAYMAAILTWADYVKIDFAAYPHLAAYKDRLRARPAVARALGEEFALFQAA